MPDRCCSVLSAERSAASIARALRIRRDRSRREAPCAALVRRLRAFQYAPAAVLPLIALRIVRFELVTFPRVDRDRRRTIPNVDGVEALFLLTDAGRGGGARL